MMARGPRKIEYADDPIIERAAALFERKRFGDWSEADQAELDAWFSESILHEVAFLRLAGHAARAERLGALRPFRRDLWANASPGRIAVRRFAIPVLAAASIVLAAAFGGRFVGHLLQPPDSVDSTDTGGRTLLTYGDHTQIELNTNTIIRTRMTNVERTVWLEKGEAWFHVAHDAAHPFTVIVGKHRITDLGTEFLVRRAADDVDVTLLSGRATLSAPSEQTATLIPGDEAMATPVSLSVTRKTPVELANALAWRRGMLMFHDAPLSEVVRQFNRYNKTKLVIVDPSVLNLKITANAKTNDYESFLELAENVLKLHVDRRGSEILISREIRKGTKRTAHARRGD